MEKRMFSFVLLMFDTEWVFGAVGWDWGWDWDCMELGLRLGLGYRALAYMME